METKVLLPSWVCDPQRAPADHNSNRRDPAADSRHTSNSWVVCREETGNWYTSVHVMGRCVCVCVFPSTFKQAYSNIIAGVCLHVLVRYVWVSVSLGLWKTDTRFKLSSRAENHFSGMMLQQKLWNPIPLLLTVCVALYCSLLHCVLTWQRHPQHKFRLQVLSFAQRNVDAEVSCTCCLFASGRWNWSLTR